MSIFRVVIILIVMGIGTFCVREHLHNRTVARISDRLNATKTNDLCRVRLGAGSETAINITNSIDQHDIPKLVSNDQDNTRIYQAFAAISKGPPVLDDFFHCERRPWLYILSEPKVASFETNVPSLNLVSEILSKPILLQINFAPTSGFPDPASFENHEPLPKGDRESFRAIQ